MILALMVGLPSKTHDLGFLILVKVLMRLVKMLMGLVKIVMLMVQIFVMVNSGVGIVSHMLGCPIGVGRMHHLGQLGP